MNERMNGETRIVRERLEGEIRPNIQSRREMPSDKKQRKSEKEGTIRRGLRVVQVPFKKRSIGAKLFVVLAASLSFFLSFRVPARTRAHFSTFLAANILSWVAHYYPTWTTRRFSVHFHKHQYILRISFIVGSIGFRCFLLNWNYTRINVVDEWKKAAWR